MTSPAGLVRACAALRDALADTDWLPANQRNDVLLPVQRLQSLALVAQETSTDAVRAWLAGGPPPE